MLVPNGMPQLLSVVIPMFNEEDVFVHLKKELATARLQWGCDSEILLVDDGSSDSTAQLMSEWANEDKSVKAIYLSRNFGHQIAVTAGLDMSAGDAVVIMDADLQDPPSVVKQMIQGYSDGYDVVYGQRTERQKETFFKLFTAKAFYILMRKFVDKNLPENVGDFRLISRRVVNALGTMRERDRFLRGMVCWVGYGQLAVPYSRPGRIAGETKYPFLKMLKFAVTAITSFSDSPLKLVTWSGIGSLILSALLIIRTLWLYFITGESLVLGWSSLSILICFFSGLIMISMGMLGIYVGKIFSQIQGRPLYLINRTANIEVKTSL